MGARLLADENVPGPAVSALRQHGHDVAWMHEDAPGTPDPEVLACAQQEGRVVVTFDKDFGQLGFRLGACPGKAHTHPDILLIVEIAESSLEYDRNVKARLNAENGIYEYWVATSIVNASSLIRSCDACRSR